MIRNVCIHVSNEQPLLADLYELPSANDAGLVCTNVRSMDGKRPIFIDQIGSTFFFPYHVVRFLEIPDREMAAYMASGRHRGPGASRGDVTPEMLAADAAYDEAFASAAAAEGEDGREPESYLPVPVGGAPGGDDADGDLEIDEDFLQRIRDI